MDRRDLTASRHCREDELGQGPATGVLAYGGDDVMQLAGDGLNAVIRDGEAALLVRSEAALAEMEALAS